MTWTYNLPFESRKDEIRFLTGDTNASLNEQMLQDEEIEYVLSMYPVLSDTSAPGGWDHTVQPLMAALVCAEAIWTYFSRQADEELPVVKFEHAARAKNYKTLVDDLRMKLYTRGGVTPYVGGISVIDKAINRFDYDRVKPFFYRREDDNKATVTAERENLLDFD
jgi:hypothetical protein